MATRSVTLTNTPQLISDKKLYAQSYGGDFNFAFSSTAPADLGVSHFDNKVFTDGTYGTFWAWKTGNLNVKLVISEAT